MSDYTKLVEALRTVADYVNCYDCEMWGLSRCDQSRKSCVLRNSADAIEAMQTMVSKLEERTKAQQERLEDYMEKQLIIDRWGAKWMTSAKDVPTAAYEHGYADGWDEARANMEVQDGK